MLTVGLGLHDNARLFAAGIHALRVAYWTVVGITSHKGTIFVAHHAGRSPRFIGEK